MKRTDDELTVSTKRSRPNRCTTLFAVWYYTIDMFRNAAGPDESERAGLMLFCLWAYMVFCSTFSVMIIAGMEKSGTAVQIAELFYYLLLIFCG